MAIECSLGGLAALVEAKVEWSIGGLSALTESGLEWSIGGFTVMTDQNFVPPVTASPNVSVSIIW